jgi:hypothetical protein
VWLALARPLSMPLFFVFSLSSWFLWFPYTLLHRSGSRLTRICCILPPINGSINRRANLREGSF